MARCVQCEKKGMSLRVNAQGLCTACEINNLNQQLSKFKTPEYTQLETVKTHISQAEMELECINGQIQTKSNELNNITSSIEAKKSELIILDDEILMQSFSLYTPIYDFADSEQYKDRLSLIREQQKAMIKNKTAVSFSQDWTVDGSLTKGKKMTNDSIKQILRSFNNECENVIDRVKFNNVDSMRQRIVKAYETLNDLNKSLLISIVPIFLQLKLEELNLAYEYQMKRQQEKEEQKRIREELREQAKLQKEIEEAKKNIIKDTKHYQNALEKLQSQIQNETDDAQKTILLVKQEEIVSKLEELDIQMKDVDYRAANQKAGYVYVISNIGSFGENVYKIGMTRRLEPMDRINELGDASVPFNFDVHALIFAEDAPALEGALHRAFADRKVNMINTRREFFKVTLEEIENVVKNNFDQTVEFEKTPLADQFRQSLLMM